MIVPRAAALSSFLTEQNVALAELFRWSTSRWIFWSLLVFLVCHANAQVGAASVGKTIPGNQVLMVYRPDFAIRMLAAELDALVEAVVRTAMGAS